MIHLNLLLREKLHGTCQEVAGGIFGLCDKVDRIYTLIIQFSQFMCPIFNNTAADFVLMHFTMSSVSWTVQCLVGEWLTGKELEGNDYGIIEFLPHHRCREIEKNCQHTPYILTTAPAKIQTGPISNTSLMMHKHAEFYEIKTTPEVAYFFKI